MCVCILRYPPCNACAPYCYLWHVRFYNIFPHLKRHDFRKKKKLFNIKCVIWFCLQLLSETFLILRRTERDTKKIYVALCMKYPLFLSDFNETWIFSTDIRKILICQISCWSVQREPSCFIRADRLDEIDGHFAQFCERPKNKVEYAWRMEDWRYSCTRY